MLPNFCYLNLNIFPFSKPLEEIMSKEWGVNEMSRLHGIEDLNPELIKFFDENKVKLRKSWILIYWWDDRFAPPHTDGDWFSDDIIKKRRCGINWNFTPGTWVEFYDSTTLTPYKRPQDLLNTFWLGTSNIIDKWDTTGPVIFNSQIIHAVRGMDTAGRRISCTLRFYETFESLTEKLKNFTHE